MTSSRATISLSALAKAAAFVSILSTLVNVGVWLLGSAVGRMTIGAGEVVTGSLVGVVAAALSLAILGRFFRRPKRAFLIAGSVVLVAYAFGPISAALAPYREGAELFTVSTVLATEVMHLVSGLSIMTAFTRPSVVTPATPAS